MFSSVFCEPMFTFFKVNVNFFAFLSVKSPPFFSFHFYFLSINWRPSPDKSKLRLIKILSSLRFNILTHVNLDEFYFKQMHQKQCLEHKDIMY